MLLTKIITPKERAALPNVAGSAYGYVDGTQHICCTNVQELIQACRVRRQVMRAWTPESGGIQPIACIEALQPVALHRFRRRQGLVSLLGVLFLANAIFLWPSRLNLPPDSWWNMFWIAIALGAIPLLFCVTWLAQHRRFSAIYIDGMLHESHYLAWLSAGRLFWTPALVMAWTLAFIVGLPLMVSFFDSAGGGSLPTVVPALGFQIGADGWPMVWTLFTSPMLHGEELHFVGNVLCFLLVAPLLEKLCCRALLPLIFLLTSIAGDLGTLLVEVILLSNPHSGGIGASGGIFGLTGYAMIFGWRQRHQLPGRYWIRVLAPAMLNTIAIAGTGYINHIHNFGMVSGMLLALWLAKPGQLPAQPTQLQNHLGVLAGVSLIGAALICCAWLVAVAQLPQS